MRVSIWIWFYEVIGKTRTLDMPRVAEVCNFAEGGPRASIVVLMGCRNCDVSGALLGIGRDGIRLLLHSTRSLLQFFIWLFFG